MSDNITPPYEGINTIDYCLNLRKVTRVVTQYYNRTMESTGIRSTQFSILLSLVNSSGKTITDMAKDLVVDRTTVNRNLKPLEKAALIMTTKLSDKRTKGYLLTHRGVLAVEKCFPLWKKAQDEINNRIGEDRLKRLTSELNYVRITI